MKIIQERDTTTIRQTVTFNASPEAVYEVLMDSQKHESLSGEKANISREIGGAFNAWGELSRLGAPKIGRPITTQ